ncbi:hypothetical protein [Oceanobacillus rekensis]|uniref:hypothetical protein n=1 Tax=Oceanobacillus rekensis TaxID=937927 RepID=UPI000B43C99E|nr:hypothetical protein [Oceanobacillus rekensis]
MYKKVLIILVILLFIVLGVSGYFIYTELNTVTEDKEPELSEESPEETTEGNARENASGVVDDEKIEKFKEEGLNLFGERKNEGELTDVDYQEYIHGMSHQKVKAEEK